jgi:hypothetical protein
MKKAFYFASMVAITMCLVSAPLAASLFSEDWETGTIDSQKWTTAGTPLPVVTTPGYEGDYALDVKGDTDCDSGVYTVDEFSTETDLKAVFWMKGNSVQNPSGMSITAGFTTGDPAIGCESEGYFLPMASIQLSSALAKGIVYRTNSGGVFAESYIDDSWHEYAIELLPDGTVDFYRDGVLKYTAPAVSIEAYPTTRFQVTGKAAYGAMPIDAIEISSQGTTCVPDFNKDGVVDSQDISDKVEAAILEFVTWKTVCWQTELTCGDYDGDLNFTRQDLKLKAMDMLHALVEWVNTCCKPAMNANTKETIETGIAQFNKFRKSTDAIIRSATAIR